MKLPRRLVTVGWIVFVLALASALVSIWMAAPARVSNVFLGICFVCALPLIVLRLRGRWQGDRR